MIDSTGPSFGGDIPDDVVGGEKDISEVEKSLTESFLETFPKLIDEYDNEGDVPHLQSYFKDKYVNFNKKEFLNFEIASYLLSARQKKIQEEDEVFWTKLDKREEDLLPTVTVEEEVYDTKLFLDTVEESFKKFKEQENKVFKDKPVFGSGEISFDRYIGSMCYDLVFILSEMGVKIENEDQTNFEKLVSLSKRRLEKREPQNTVAL